MYERPGRPAGPSRCARVAEAAQREREGGRPQTRGGGAPEQLKQRVRFYEAGQNHVPRGSGSHRPPAARRVRPATTAISTLAMRSTSRPDTAPAACRDRAGNRRLDERSPSKRIVVAALLSIAAARSG